MTKRNKVQLVEQIRKAHATSENPSIRDLSRTFNTHRRMVREALTIAVPPERKEWQHPAPSLDPWKATIDAWLETDRLMPRKQRHTARRVHQRLVVEYGAELAMSSKLYEELVREIGLNRPLPQEAHVPGKYARTPDELEDEQWASLLTRTYEESEGSDIPF